MISLSCNTYTLLGGLGSSVGGGQGMHTLRAHPSYKASEYADSYHNITRYTHAQMRPCTETCGPCSHSASQSLLLFHIHHPSGRQGDNTIRLAPAEHVPTPRGGPQGRKRYGQVYTYASSDSTAALQD